MAPTFRKSAPALLCAFLLASMGCDRGGPTVNTTSSSSIDFRKLSTEEISAKIKEVQHDEFKSVTLTKAGDNTLSGTAVGIDGTEYELSATVSADRVSYKAKGDTGIISGSVNQSSKKVETNVKFP